VALEVKNEVAAMTSPLGTQPGHKLFAWAQKQQRLTHHAGTTGSIDDAHALAFTSDRRLATGYADSLEVPAGRPRYMLHVKTRDSAYVGERLGTTGAKEAYRIGFVPADDAVALYVRPNESAAWFMLKRHDSCSLEEFLATGDALSTAVSIGRVSKASMPLDLAALRAAHRDVGALAGAIEEAMNAVRN